MEVNNSQQNGGNARTYYLFNGGDARLHITTKFLLSWKTKCKCIDYYAVTNFLIFILGFPGLDCLEAPNKNKESRNSVKLYVHVLREVNMLCGRKR